MEQLKILKTNNEVLELIEYLRDKDIVSVDTETTGVTEDAEIIGLSLCAEADVGYYVVTAYWDVPTQAMVYLETLDTIKTLCEALLGKQLVMHNAVFDCAKINSNYKVDLMPSVFADTMIMAHLLDENRRVGLKELSAAKHGASAKKEQEEMKASVAANGGVLTKDKYELYKADVDLIAKYGAKDAILTYNLFFELVPELYEENLDKFYFEDESMPLLRGPTYQLNTVGLKIDQNRLITLKKSLEVEILCLKEEVHNEIQPYIKDKYPGTSKLKTFNINSGDQLSWLIYDKLENLFPRVSDAGRDLAKALGMTTPYSNVAKRNFIAQVQASKGQVWREANEVWDPKTRKYKAQAKVRDYWTYLSTDKVSLLKVAQKYRWIAKLLEYKRLSKLLSTYVEGMEAATHYGVIRPSFLQHGTTSGRYSCRNPNFQNLPRDDKRIKACIVARQGKVFVGADYSQLEPRVFASLSGDERLLKCFKDGDDFYSVVGAPVFGVSDCTFKKDDSPQSFPVKYKKLRDVAKVIALATPYGTQAPQMSSEIAIKAGMIKSMDECQEIIDNYFASYPSVHKLMMDAHERVKRDGVVYSLYGRPRRIPEAKAITETYGDLEHGALPRSARNLLNLAMNHPIQSSGASIMNRSAIAIYNTIQDLAAVDATWKEVKIVLQVHDSLVLEGPEALKGDMVTLMRDCMEGTVSLPGVDLIAEPKIGNDIAEV